jgi:hypothetical protein
VVGGQADDVHGVDVVLPQPVREPDLLLLVVAVTGRAALEAGVRCGALALAEPGVHRHVERRMRLGARGADPAVRGPAVHEIGLLGEVVTRVDVPVQGADHRPVAIPVRTDVLGDRCGHGASAGHRQRTTLAEVVLHVDDDQGAAHGSSPPGGSGGS